MKHNLSISVSNKTAKHKVVTFKKLKLREKFMRFLFGDIKKVTILVPGDSVQEVSITECEPGGGTNAF